MNLDNFGYLKYGQCRGRSEMSLSDRIRPDCEAAPWVIKEVKEMESEIKRLKDQNDRYQEALELALELAENGLVDFKKYGLNEYNDIIKKYREALKEIE
jgi:hypothetical protein